MTLSFQLLYRAREDRNYFSTILRPLQALEAGLESVMYSMENCTIFSQPSLPLSFCDISAKVFRESTKIQTVEIHYPSHLSLVDFYSLGGLCFWSLMEEIVSYCARYIVHILLQIFAHFLPLR